MGRERKTMGKEYRYWPSGRFSRRSNGYDDEKRDSATTDARSSLGCMTAVFHFFDFHPSHHHFVFNHQNQHESPTTPRQIPPDEIDLSVPKGFEAPRNSLELSEEPALSPRNFTKDENFHHHPMRIKIKAPSGGTATTASDIANMNSPSTKTPTLVARLMGLDLLPETQSPSSHSSSISSLTSLSKKRLPCHINTNSGTRSLPETPRVLSSSSRRSDVDQHHRLSLQIINKENNMSSTSEEPKRRELKTMEDEMMMMMSRNSSSSSTSTSPSYYYARQIVKQVKESVSRKVNNHNNVLNDITNTVSSNQDHVIQSQDKKKKASLKGFKKAVDGQDNCSSTTPNSCSPRLRVFLEPKKTVSSSSTSSLSASTCIQEERNSQLIRPACLDAHHEQSIKSKLEALMQEKNQQKKQHEVIMANQRSKREVNERFSARLIKKPQQEESLKVAGNNINTMVNPEHKLQCKKKTTPLSNNLVNLKKVPQKQVSKGYSSDKYTSQKGSSYIHVAQVNENTDITTPNATTHGGEEVAAADAEFQYITRTLSLIGISKDSTKPVSFAWWFSPSHPLDPSIFDYLENYPEPYSLLITFERSNRRLLFDLVDELLVQILRPCDNFYDNYGMIGNMRRSSRDCHMRGSKLIDTLWERVRSFPRANCQFLEEIDGLVEKDLKGTLTATEFEEGGRGVVREFEREILDSLVHETVEMVSSTCRFVKGRERRERMNE